MKPSDVRFLFYYTNSYFSGNFYETFKSPTEADWGGGGGDNHSIPFYSFNAIQAPIVKFHSVIPRLLAF